MTVGCLEAERHRAATHTCFVVDQLQNERSAGDDAGPSRKEVPEEESRHFNTSAKAKILH